MIRGFDQTGIAVADLDRSIAFYCSVFELIEVLAQ